MPDPLRRAFDKLRRSSEDRDIVYGIMGKPDGTVKVAARDGWAYVRLGVNGELGITIAQNINAPYEANRPVRLQRRGDLGDYVIVGVHEALMEVFAGSNPYYGDVPNHSHQIGSGMEYEIEALRMEPGRVVYHVGMNVYVRPFRYYYNNAWQTWLGGLLNLATYQPSTADYWAWVLIGINPATNTAVAATGTEYPVTTSLTRSMIDNINFSDYIPCVAVKVKESDTDVSDIDDYQDARGWFNASATTSSTINAIIIDSDGNMMFDADGNLMTEC